MNAVNQSAAEFDEQDLKDLAEAKTSYEAEVGVETIPAEGAAPAAAPAAAAPAPEAPPAAPAAPAPSQAPAAPAQAPAAQAAPAAPAAPAPAPAPAPNLHAALRVAQRQIERLAAENEALKANAPAANAPAPVPKMTAEQLEELKSYDPELYKQVNALQQANEVLAAKAATAAAPAPAREFEPVQYDAETQKVINEVPDLLAMQYNPDQTAFKLAIGFERVLAADPAWQGKSDVERLAEAARQAQQRLSGSASPTPAPAGQPTEAEKAAALAKAQAAAAAAAPALSIGDLRGGGNPNTQEPDYSQMDDTQILASLG